MLLLSTQVWSSLSVEEVQGTCACTGSEGPYKVGYLNFVTIFVVLRPNPICDLFTRVFTGVKGMLEGFQHIVGNSLKVKPTKGSNSPNVGGMYNRTQLDMSAANLVTWG